MKKYTHHRIEKLEMMLEKDGVPLEELKDAFILVNREVLKHQELVAVMGAEEIGLVTKAAQRLLDRKLSVPKKSTKKKSVKKKALSAKAQIAALNREANKELEDLNDADWEV